MTAPSTNQDAGRQTRTGSASPGGALIPAGRYPAAAQPATTAGALRAAADLIERSAIAGLSVTCCEGRIQIQVTSRCGDASACAVVACLAGWLGSACAVQEDSHASDDSWIEASGSAGGLPAEVFTPLAVQHVGPGPDGSSCRSPSPPTGGSRRCRRPVTCRPDTAGSPTWTRPPRRPPSRAHPATPHQAPPPAALGRRTARTPGRGRQARP